MTLEWTVRYGVYTAHVGRVGTLMVGWQDPRIDRPAGWKVSAFGVSLKAVAPDAGTGKTRAVALARKLLAEADAALAEAAKETA